MIQEVYALLTSAKVSANLKIKEKILSQVIPKVSHKVNTFVKLSRTISEETFKHLCLILTESQNLTNFVPQTK